jgi:hypothetical protein
MTAENSKRVAYTLAYKLGAARLSKAVLRYSIRFTNPINNRW